MSNVTGWIILVVALLVGALGGILAAEVAGFIFWIGYAIGLGLVGFFIWKSREDGISEDVEPQPEPVVETPAAE